MNKTKALILAWGIPGLFAFAILDGAGLPLPGGLDLALIWLASQMPDRIYALAATAVVGSTIGVLILFSLARKGGEMYLSRHTMSKTGQRFRHWFQHYGLLTVFITALVPIPVMPMKIFVLCSGALGSSRRAFLSVFAFARVIRYVALATLGARMGDDAWKYLRANKWNLALIAIGMFAVLYALVKIADRRRLSRPGSAEPDPLPDIES